MQIFVEREENKSDITSEALEYFYSLRVDQADDSQLLADTWHKYPELNDKLLEFCSPRIMWLIDTLTVYCSDYVETEEDAISIIARVDKSLKRAGEKCNMKDNVDILHKYFGMSVPEAERRIKTKDLEVTIALRYQREKEFEDEENARIIEILEGEEAQAKLKEATKKDVSIIDFIDAISKDAEKGEKDKEDSSQDTDDTEHHM